MHRRHNNILFLFIILAIVHSIQLSDENMRNGILNHMTMAFNNIVKDSRMARNLINKMYDGVTDDPVISFKLPQEKTSTNSTGSSIVMSRSEMVNPNFPNVTSKFESFHESLMMKTTDLMASSSSARTSELNVSKEQMLYPISGTTIRKIRSRKIQQQSLQKKQSNNSFAIENNTVNDSDVNSVYLARANNRFGYSLQWSKRATLNHTRLKQSSLDDNRFKRDVIALYSMIECATACDPLNYKNHGCFCGFLGMGTPVDGVDHCCRSHDKCYAESGCISYLQYFVPYVWKCYHGKPLCASSHGEWGGPGSCAARLCACDLSLSLCLRKHACPRRKAVCRSSRARRLQNLIFI